MLIDIADHILYCRFFFLNIQVHIPVYNNQKASYIRLHQYIFSKFLSAAFFQKLRQYGDDPVTHKGFCAEQKMILFCAYKTVCQICPMAGKPAEIPRVHQQADPFIAL